MTKNNKIIRPYIRGIRGLAWRIGNEFAPAMFFEVDIFLSTIAIWNQKVCLKELSTKYCPSIDAANATADKFMRHSLRGTTTPMGPHAKFERFGDFRDDVVKVSRKLVRFEFDGLVCFDNHCYDGTALENVFTIYLNNLKLDEFNRAKNPVEAERRVGQYVSFYWDDSAGECPISDSEFEF